MYVFLSVLTISYGLASVIAEDTPKWPAAVSVSFELNSLISDFGMKVQHYFSRAQISSRWDINEGASKLYVTYKDSNTSGMYYYFPITTAQGKNETACYFLPMIVLNGTAGIPSVLPDLTKFHTDRGNATVEKWVYGVAMEDWEEIQNIYVQKKNNSGKIAPVLAKAELKFYMKTNDVRTKLWTHTNKVFHDYDSSEPDRKVWQRPEDVKCSVISVDAAEYLIYLVDMYLALPTEPILDQLYVGEIYYLATGYKYKSKRKLPLESIHGVSFPRYYTNGDGMTSTSISGVPDAASPRPAKKVAKLTGGLPERFDWREHGAVTEVRDQGICRGSSWAFSVVGAMEGAYFLKTKKLVNMSEQALVDCSWWFGNSGCFSGLPESAFNWIKQNGGIPLARDYGRFQEGHGYCLATKVKPIAPIKGFFHVEPKSDAVKSALVEHGPLVVGISTPNDLHYYVNGVYQSAEWDGINQYVVLVGYGTNEEEPYWLIKNSWSGNWGLNGYAMISAENDMLNLLDSFYYVDIDF